MPRSALIKNDGLLAALDDCLAEQDRLCVALESLADSLPGAMDTLAALRTVRRLRVLLRRAHRLEETHAFPLLAGVVLDSQVDLRPVLDRLRAEHAENEDYAADLEEALSSLPRWPLARSDAERLGYLLRGLFMSLRRHVAQDRDWVRPLLRKLEPTAPAFPRRPPSGQSGP